MATNADWTRAYARQAEADISTFLALQPLAIPACHKLQFLQMGCEKLVKAQHCALGREPRSLAASHAVIEKHLPSVLRQQMEVVRMPTAAMREILRHTRPLAGEIELLAPSVRRRGKRLDKLRIPVGRFRGLIALAFGLDVSALSPANATGRAGNSQVDRGCRK